MQKIVIDIAEGKPPAGEKQLALLRRSIRIICTVKPDFSGQDPLPATYEGIYNACRSAVVISGLGEELYNILKIGMEQSIGSMLRLLANSRDEKVAWMTLFNDLFTRFEEQNVSWLKSSLHGLVNVVSRLYSRPH